MNKRTGILIIVALLLVGFWVYAFSGLFDSDRIQIATKLIQPRKAKSGNNVYPVVFGFNSDFVLESIKVVPAEPGPGEDAQPLWHLVYSDKAQQKAKRRAEKRPNRFQYPITNQSLVYGRKVDGLKPAEKGADAEPLEPNTPYRLVIEARSGWGQTKFKTQKLAGG